MSMMGEGRHGRNRLSVGAVDGLLQTVDEVTWALPMEPSLTTIGAAIMADRACAMYAAGCLSVSRSNSLLYIMVYRDGHGRKHFLIVARRFWGPP